MKISKMVFATDQVNRARMRIPASVLMSAYERDVEECVRSGVELGLPMHMQHDMHRLIGWSRPLGLYLDASMVRSFGQGEEPTSEEEKNNLAHVVDDHWARHHRAGTEFFERELMERLSPANLSGAKLIRMEAAVVHRAGIASELYPHLFVPGVGLVDKDGLADYRDLADRMKQIQPGVFYDSERDVLLFAHRFFRRSLSHRNKLNTYFLQSFGGVARSNDGLRVRIRLDPDILGHPESAQEIVEMEYWHGPKFSDEISSIPSAVAEYKADERTREHQGVDRTHIWWKVPETRDVDGELVGYRTFEIEELIENESWGLGADIYGCRYAHAEFSDDEAAITHFDGAIRAYEGEAYLERIETSIDKAGKQAAYTKLFRIDGPLSIADWKRLLSDHYQGNPLIPEYFGACAESDADSVGDVEMGQDDAAAKLSGDIEPVGLAAFISLDSGSISVPLGLSPELHHQIGHVVVRCVEIGVGAVGSFMRLRFDLEKITTVGANDSALNLSRICFGPSDDLAQRISNVAGELAAALREEAQAGILQTAAVPLTWGFDGMLVTLSFAGEVELVARALVSLPTLVDFSQPPSFWIQEISDFVKKASPSSNVPCIWRGLRRGLLEIQRTVEADAEITLPEDVLRQLGSNEKLKSPL